MAVTTGLDTAVAPAASKARAILDEVDGAFWAVYIGGPYYHFNGWSPAIVKDYAAAGVTQFLPIYVGQQASGTLTADQGYQDGKEAVQLLQHFGWGPGTPCALDVEAGTSQGDLDGATAYADGFCVALRQANYVPGVYGVGAFLGHLRTQTNRPSFVYVANWLRTGVDHALEPGHIPNQTALPDTAWPEDRVWQYAAGVTIQGVEVDIDVANCPLAGVPGSGVVAAGDGHTKIINAARTYVDTPYLFGGGHTDDGRNGIDCSGLLLQAFQAAGCPQPNNTADGLYKSLAPISWDDIRDGDCLFFDWDHDGIADHCGIRSAYRVMIDAAEEGIPVREHSMTDTYLQHLMDARCPFGGH